VSTTLVHNKPWSRLTATVCRRAFSSPEAFLYEVTVARAVATIVEPAVISAAQGAFVLDVGCGGGRLAERVGHANTSAVVAVDPATSQARRVARRRAPGLTACQAAAEELPFRDASFDALYSSCALKHWPSPAAGLAECRRVTKPGGAIVIVEVDGESTPGEVRAFTRHTRIPVGLREAYVRFAMRTVVDVAPDRTTLASAFHDAHLAAPAIEKLPGLPFLVARTSAP
jgi:ubiquinone/menaquinone biosynthesis C-methylase UbiE